MSMVKVKIKEQQQGEANLEIEIDKSEVNDRLEKIYNDLSYKVKIPGFRQGKIPKNILNLHLGKEYFYQKLAEEIIPDSYREAIKEVNLEPITQPKINITQIVEDKPLIYEAKIQLKPEVKIGNLEELEIKREDKFVSETDVINELKRLQENQAILKVVKDRKAKEGDFLVIDAEAFLEGKPIEKTKVEKQLIQIGKSPIPEFNQQLVNSLTGEEKEIKINIPQEAKDKNIAGKEITYKIKVLEIKEKELPELNDDFAKKLGNYQNLEELKEEIRKELNRQIDRINRNNFEQTLIEKVTEISEVKVPEVLIERELDYMMKYLESDLKAQNITLSDYYRSINSDEEKVKQEYRIVAEKRVKQELVLDKLSKEFKIEVREEEVKNKIKAIAQEINQDPLKVEANFIKEDNLEALKENIKREKILEHLTRQIKIINSKKEKE